MEIYKPLTPSLRLSINKSFDEQISELHTCKPNALVNAQINALKNGQKAYKRIAGRVSDAI